MASLIPMFAHLLGFKNGGRVGRTGPALLHKGEVVLPAHCVKCKKAPRRHKRR